MSKGKGYLVPGEPIATDCGCIMVFYPDREEYLWALMGALQYLETWVAWERDDAHNGRFAADMWKEANQLTRDNMNCSTGIKEGLFAIANAMARQGCCDGVTPVQVVGIPPTWLDGGDTGLGGGDILNPPPSWNPVNDYDDYKCRAAGAIVFDLVQTLIQMSTLSGLLSAVGAAAFYALLNTTLLSGVIVGLMGIGLTASGAVFLMIGALFTLATAGAVSLALLGTIANNIDTETLVCELYGALNTSDAEIYVSQAIAEAINLIGASNDRDAASDFITSFAKLILTQDMFTVLFNYDEETALRAPLHTCDCAEPVMYAVTPMTNIRASTWTDTGTQETRLFLMGDTFEVSSGTSIENYHGYFLRLSKELLSTIQVVSLTGYSVLNSTNYQYTLRYLTPVLGIELGKNVAIPIGYIMGTDVDDFVITSNTPFSCVFMVV